MPPYTIHRVFRFFSLPLLIVACSNSDVAPATSAVSAQAALNAQANAELKLYEQMRGTQGFDLAAPLGEEILKMYPTSDAAQVVQRSIVEVRAKAANQIESRRLARLWAYNAAREAGGTQFTAAIYSKDDLKRAPIPKDAKRIRLILREHPKWGQSVYLMLDNAVFDCSGGCATLPVRFDDAPPQHMKATIPPTGEPALFIDDDKGFIAKLQKARAISIDVALKIEGKQSVSFEVGGYDASKLPPRPAGK